MWFGNCCLGKSDSSSCLIDRMNMCVILKYSCNVVRGNGFNHFSALDAHARFHWRSLSTSIRVSLWSPEFVRFICQIFLHSGINATLQLYLFAHSRCGWYGNVSSRAFQQSAPVESHDQRPKQGLDLTRTRQCSTCKHSEVLQTFLWYKMMCEVSNRCSKL